MNDLSGARSALSLSISFSSHSTCASVTVSRAPPGPFFRQAEIGLDVEQVVLDAAERRIERASPARVQPHQPEHGIDLVERAVGLDAQIVFLAPRAGAERCRAVVAGAGVDAVEHDHALSRASAALRIRASTLAYSTVPETERTTAMRTSQDCTAGCCIPGSPRRPQRLAGVSLTTQTIDLAAAKQKKKRRAAPAEGQEGEGQIHEERPKPAKPKK